MPTVKALTKSIMASAKALHLTHPQLHFTKQAHWWFTDLTHMENDMEILYLGLSADEEDITKAKALEYMDAALKTDLLEVN